MKDGCGRTIDYLRISVTDRCNLRCRYCMPRDIPLVPMEEILSYEEILRAVRAFAALGIRHLRVTGGEPLVRRGLPELIRGLTGIPGIESVGMTTNGVLLKEELPALLGAGLGSVNISLDTMDREQYRRITGTDALPRVLEGLEAAMQAGLPVKINAVSCRREEEPDWFLPLAALARDLPVAVRFIELMPIGAARGQAPLSEQELRRGLEEAFGPLTRTEEHPGWGPAVYWKPAAFRGTLGFISPIHGRFCSACNRVRLTSQGYLRTCLSHGDGADLRAFLRNPLRTDADLESAIREAVARKPAGHCFDGPGEPEEESGMSRIGG